MLEPATQKSWQELNPHFFLSSSRGRLNLQKSCKGLTESYRGRTNVTQKSYIGATKDSGTGSCCNMSRRSKASDAFEAFDPEAERMSG